MPTLIYRNQVANKKPEVIKRNARHLHELIFLRWPDGLPEHNHQVFVNNQRVAGDMPLNADDVVTVVAEVKGVVDVAFGFITGVGGDVLNFALDALGLIPEIPEYDTDRKSPNNNYSGQTNIIRENSGLPLVLGSPVIYPDLIGEAIETYVDNEKRIDQYFQICFGKISGGVVQAGNTPLSRFAGAIKTIYEPNSSGITMLPDYTVGVAVDEIDGQLLNGPNTPIPGVTSELVSTSGTVPASDLTSGVFTLYVDNTTAAQDLKSQFDLTGTFDTTLDYVIIVNISPDGPTPLYRPVRATGIGSVTNVQLTSGYYTITISSFVGPESETGDYNAWAFDTSTDFALSTTAVQILGPVITPALTDTMLINFGFPQGLKATVTLRVVLTELDSKGGTPTGTTYTYNIAYVGDTLDPQFRTYEITPPVAGQWYEFAVQKTSNDLNDTATPDATYIERVTCTQNVGDWQIDNATILRVVLPGTARPTGSGVDNKINVRGALSVMKTYDVMTSVISDSPSRKMADAILYAWMSFYERDPAELDLDALYEIQNRLDAINPELATFDYTFDDATQTVDEVIATILNVARCYHYRDTKIRFRRDEAVEFDSTLITRADVADESERDYSLQFNGFKPGSFDSVRVEYIDRTINKPAFINRRIVGGVIVDGIGQNQREFKLVGCQSQANAINRAELEIRKLLFNRWTLTDTCKDSHQFLQRGDTVLYEEVYEQINSGGEILAVNGNTAELSEYIEPTASGVFYYTNALGDVVGPLTFTRTGDYTLTVTSGNLLQVFLRDNSAQVGSRYMITTTDAALSSRFVLQSKVSNGYNTQITAFNYDARVYEFD